MSSSVRGSDVVSVMRSPGSSQGGPSPDGVRLTDCSPIADLLRIPALTRAGTRTSSSMPSVATAVPSPRSIDRTLPISTSR